MGFINSVKGKILMGFILAAIVFVSFNGQANMTHYTMAVWLHVAAGVLWIGLLYYFNFVQVPGMGQALADKGGPGPAAIGKYIAPRALLWFRMAAATTWILGLVLLALQSRGMDGIMGAFTFAKGYQIIGIGAWMGTVMAFNVWFIIWPNQQKILGMKSATDGEIATAKKNAALASSINVILSVPMLLTMIAWH
ncbi:Glutamate synthase [NADPH] large chain [Bathymodiolus thermophilus thioautotrophic gill symbiont]|uniref:urate hydroxylase PuuD n=1 Tax=Bathymodiolus thermophilus thioautotrophic gill symbiont TaxID=2360 RepID=UPI0010BA26C2|nr:urate hydroxylase PuuD [Bathymodiolus thermophilus thioautotrophic gill symbiont]SGZ60060.1 Glutamate synthase [NADPH] large chain [Bathymodiolus thermophilus thioautotrophic gill symbiont]